MLGTLRNRPPPTTSARSTSLTRSILTIATDKPSLFNATRPDMPSQPRLTSRTRAIRSVPDRQPPTNQPNPTRIKPPPPDMPGHPNPRPIHPDRHVWPTLTDVPCHPRPIHVTSQPTPGRHAGFSHRRSSHTPRLSHPTPTVMRPSSPRLPDNPTQPPCQPCPAHPPTRLPFPCRQAGSPLPMPTSHYPPGHRDTPIHTAPLDTSTSQLTPPPPGPCQPDWPHPPISPPDIPTHSRTTSRNMPFHATVQTLPPRPANASPRDSPFQSTSPPLPGRATI